jgi:integrase
MSNLIIRQNTRILTPREYYLMREELNPKYKIISGVLINTGMRVEEFWDFRDHPHWFDAARRCIDLPKGSKAKGIPGIKKTKSAYQERTVNLTVEGCDAIKTLISMNSSIRYTNRVNMGAALKRAAKKARIGETGIVPKMFRKSLVSWLVTCHPERYVQISSSIGHELETMRIHYANLAFERRDTEDMRKFLNGWGVQ